MKMIERVIRSMQDTGLIDGMSLEDADTLATAALEAMREPSEIMKSSDAGICTTNTKVWNAALYRAMIDAALNE